MVIRLVSVKLSDRELESLCEGLRREAESLARAILSGRHDADLGAWLDLHRSCVELQRRLTEAYAAGAVVDDRQDA